MAAAIEEAGFDVWLSDHVVLIEEPRSRYPFSDDGEFFVAPREDWYEFVATAAYVAGVTTTADVCVGVCIAALRHPLELAKQLATLDRLSRGRLRFGAGTGWLTEEFAALGVPSDARGGRLDAVLDLLREAWSGHPSPGQYGPYEVPTGVRSHPTPSRRVPIYISGSSDASLRRVVTRGDGWLGMAPGGRIEPETVIWVRRRITELCRERGRDPDEIELALRIGVPGRSLGTSEIVERLKELRRAGIERFVADIGWKGLQDARNRLAALRAGMDAVASEPVNRG